MADTVERFDPEIEYCPDDVNVKMSPEKHGSWVTYMDVYTGEPDMARAEAAADDEPWRSFYLSREIDGEWTLDGTLTHENAKRLARAILGMPEPTP